ncbi:biofilm-forming protein [Bacillus swezeyi]|uniref:Biofilm-forming protein n=1 Tax=Bacillus swezeyi TaxID=1925020 RepID=A0A5M8S239_9BACI|nr:biofilm-forming protein [Bacillus swezeyi]KAA6452192.1 biofilm-forming protein [Bacillus swezeyi]KAA6473770.1 biofilm-forming protein [Bacillus swezeyi]TYS36337.1 biofilm-forming protein [Bacillus swezeyi]
MQNLSIEQIRNDRETEAAFKANEKNKINKFLP